jgi:hypothetical protein
MQAWRFSEEQMIGKIRVDGTVWPRADMRRKHRFSSTALHEDKAKFGRVDWPNNQQFRLFVGYQ